MNEHDLLAEIASAMQFPDYFGGNWDALEECLRDMKWLPAKGYVLVLKNSTELWRSMPRIAGKLIESWLFVAEQWSRENIAFHLVFLL